MKLIYSNLFTRPHFPDFRRENHIVCSVQNMMWLTFRQFWWSVLRRPPTGACRRPTHTSLDSCWWLKMAPSVFILPISPSNSDRKKITARGAGPAVWCWTMLKTWAYWREFSGSAQVHFRNQLLIIIFQLVFPVHGLKWSKDNVSRHLLVDSLFLYQNTDGNLINRLLFVLHLSSKNSMLLVDLILDSHRIQFSLSLELITGVQFYKEDLIWSEAFSRSRREILFPFKTDGHCLLPFSEISEQTYIGNSN